MFAPNILKKIFHFVAIIHKLIAYVSMDYETDWFLLLSDVKLWHPFITLTTRFTTHEFLNGVSSHRASERCRQNILFLPIFKDENQILYSIIIPSPQFIGCCPSDKLHI